MPLVRSRNQLLVLGHLLVWADCEWESREIMQAKGVSQASVSSELTRLSNSGLLRRRMVGRTLLVQADPTVAVFEPLRALMMMTYGPIPVLTALLADADDVTEAHIVGSWAHRICGTPGHWPHDVDIVAVSPDTPFALTDLTVEAEAILGVPVHMTTVTAEQWAVGDGFVADMKSKPIVTLDLSQHGPRRTRHDQPSPGSDPQRGTPTSRADHAAPSRRQQHVVRRTPSQPSNESPRV